MRTNCVLSILLIFLCVSQIQAQNNAAYFSGFSKYYRCGNITISGNQLTVEALVKLDGTGPYVTGQSANDIVSKHNGANDANYILRPDHCEITTTNGHFYTALNLPAFSKDSFYHVAMTYNGSFLKFYVNGCLFSEVAATGNLINNNYITTIGQLASNPTALSIEQLYGYTDEVRIWSIARTQAEIKNNIHSLSNPTAQSGLIAYYKFEGNSLNVQGNNTYDAVPFGNPVITQQNGFAAVKNFDATYSIQQPSCNATNGSITVNAQGGKSPYKFSLNGGTYQSSNVFGGLSSGSYNISVKTDGLGCVIDTLISLNSSCPPSDCNNWLRVPSHPSFVKIGDLDIPGDKVTVEAVFNRTAPWSGADVWQGDLVSKHEGPYDCNYLLRPSSAEITTTNGYFKTPVICPIQLNKRYHAAMVYDGSTLKFYRNGVLMSQVAASGDLYQNNWETQFGLFYAQVMQTNFIGYINEVRIWNIPRTQTQIQTYMNQSLPNPQTQTGLLAYYSFDNLINKQGNAIWNGTLGGNASINATNPVCNFIADSCNVIVTPNNPTSCSGLQIALGGSLTERAYDIAATNNNQIFVAGTTNSYGNGDQILISKLTETGSVLWSKTYGGSNTESVRKINATADGGLILTGQTKSYNNPNGDILCMKIDASGNILWSRRFGVGSPAGDLGMDIIETTDGGYAVSGIINVNGIQADYVVIKLDNLANISWTKRYDRGDGEDGVGLIQKGDTLVAACDLMNNGSHYEFQVMKLKLSDGSFIMSKKFKPAVRGLFNPYIFKNPTQPGYIISGHTLEFDNYNYMRHTLIYLNENLDFQQTKLISVSPQTNDFFTGFVPMPDGSFIGCASPQNNSDGYFYRVNADNTISYSKKFNSTDARRLYRMAVSNNKVVAVGGAVLNGQEDFFITSFDAGGNTAAFCDVENVTISVEQPSYNTSNFSWPSITTPIFNNTSIALVSVDVILQKTNLCTNLSAIDFNYSQDFCNPKKIEFSSSISGIQSYQWSFGDGQINTNSLNPTVFYNNYGSFDVKLVVQYNSGCLDSMTKTIIVDTNIDHSLIGNNDTSICLGQNIVLATSGDYLQFCWQSDNGYNNTTSSTITVSPQTTTTYTFSSQFKGDNLVVNGNFNGGNTGFTSQYTLSNSGLPAGVYSVASNVPAWHPAMPACGDHTTGTGNMMMVNGASQQNVQVWRQTISVQPNTNYAFSTWLQNISTINPAQLQFSINGVQLGNIFNANIQSCVWDQFYTVWNSGNNTSATIAIINMNQGFSGNDFALDDIFFGKISNKTDSIKVTVLPSPGLTLNNDTTICKGSAVQLNANISNGSNISWTPVTYLNNTTIPNPVAVPDNTIKYYAEVINNSGCTRKDSIQVTVLENPIISMPSDTSTCAGVPLTFNSSTNNATSFGWFPTTGLSDPSIANPIATPSGTTQYTLTASNAGGCFDSKSITVTVNPLPDISISNPSSICEGAQVPLDATGGIAYTWTPTAGLSNRNISNPIAQPSATTMYTANVTGSNGCTNYDSVLVTVTPKPVFSIQPQLQSICIGEPVTITASGGDVYTWVNTSSTSNNIFVNPTSTTEYTVYVRNLICDITDTLSATIKVNPLPDITINKSNDIDCSNFQTRLTASGGTTYEWSPATNLSNPLSSNPTATPLETTTYVVRVGSADGCYAEDSINVKVSAIGDASSFHVPSAFTPNNDGKNDCFGLRHWGNVKEFTLDVYNRWGEIVFSTKNNSQCWNGTYKGQQQPSGVFVYYVKAKTLCGDVIKKGTITLIR